MFVEFIAGVLRTIKQAFVSIRQTSLMFRLVVNIDGRAACATGAVAAEITAMVHTIVAKLNAIERTRFAFFLNIFLLTF